MQIIKTRNNISSENVYDALNMISELRNWNARCFKNSISLMKILSVYIDNKIYLSLYPLDVW